MVHASSALRYATAAELFLAILFLSLVPNIDPPSKVGMGRLDNGFANGFLGKGEKKSCKVRGDVKGGANVNQTN